MELPTKIVDISMPLDNETVADPEIMRPQISHVNHQENAKTMANFFDGMKPEDLPDGKLAQGNHYPHHPQRHPYGRALALPFP